MLQQTQVDRVVPTYRRFLHRFPTWEALAQAPFARVLAYWHGLGYNRRAKYLHALAKTVVQEYEGRLPENEEALTKLPGIGAYTARAILAFAFRKRVAPIDTNVARVVRRYFLGAGEQEERRIAQDAEAALPHRGVYWWNHALMDFGAMTCTARSPACGTCPLREQCRAAPFFRRGGTEQTRRKPHLPFPRTRRFLRGKIVQELLRGAQTQAALIKKLQGSTSFSAREIRRTIHELETESFIATRNRRLEISGAS